MCLCVPVYVCAWVCTCDMCDCGGWKRASQPLEPEFQTIVSHHWVLEIEARSCGWAAGDFKCRASLQPHRLGSYYILPNVCVSPASTFNLAWTQTHICKKISFRFCGSILFRKLIYSPFYTKSCLSHISPSPLYRNASLQTGWTSVPGT